MGQDVPVVALRDGNLIPQLGFGTWQIPTADCPLVLREAIRVGYRLFDTAQAYATRMASVTPFATAASNAANSSSRPSFVTARTSATLPCAALTTR